MTSDLTPQAARILDCAQALIAGGGYNAFSYADISAQVGITKASIHHHFPTKAGLARMLVQRYRAAAAEGMASLDAAVPDPAARLRAYAGWWSACIADGSRPICICAMLAAEILALPPEVADEVRAHFTHLADWLRGVLKPLPLQATAAAEAQAFMATVHGAMLSARACDDPRLFARIVGAAVERLATPFPTPKKKTS